MAHYPLAVSKPVVALVGRPNVGKSTLFNRLVGEREAIVEDIPGTTRDRHYADCDWSGRIFTLIDTGGITASTSASGVEARVQEQARMAIAEADVIVWLVDAVAGLLPEDEEVARLLRRSGKPVVCAANKADNQRLRAEADEFYALAFGTPLPISAIHGTGTGDLLDAIVAVLPPSELEDEEDPQTTRIAIVGRPNVGKSSLVNALLGEERVIVDSQPGTTRDAIDTFLRYKDHPVVLIDTAGIRRRGKVEVGIEKYGVFRAVRAINRADVALLVIDAVEGFTAQDAHVAGYVEQAGRGVVVVVNKWDLRRPEGLSADRLRAEARAKLAFLHYTPIFFVSARTGLNVTEPLEAALRIKEERARRVPTARLNSLVREAQARHAPPSGSGGQRLRIYYATQASSAPPTFVFFVNDSSLCHFSYRRFLENQLRQAFGFEGTPLRLYFRNRAA